MFDVSQAHFSHSMMSTLPLLVALVLIASSSSFKLVSISPTPLTRFAWDPTRAPKPTPTPTPSTTDFVSTTNPRRLQFIHRDKVSERRAYTLDGSREMTATHIHHYLTLFHSIRLAPSSLGALLGAGDGKHLLPECCVGCL